MRPGATRTTRHVAGRQSGCRRRHDHLRVGWRARSCHGRVHSSLRCGSPGSARAPPRPPPPPPRPPPPPQPLLVLLLLLPLRCHVLPPCVGEKRVACATPHGADGRQSAVCVVPPPHATQCAPPHLLVVGLAASASASPARVAARHTQTRSVKTHRETLPVRAGRGSTTAESRKVLLAARFEGACTEACATAQEQRSSPELEGHGNSRTPRSAPR